MYNPYKSNLFNCYFLFTIAAEKHREATIPFADDISEFLKPSHFFDRISSFLSLSLSLLKHKNLNSNCFDIFAASPFRIRGFRIGLVARRANSREKISCLLISRYLAA